MSFETSKVAPISTSLPLSRSSSDDSSLALVSAPPPRCRFGVRHERARQEQRYDEDLFDFPQVEGFSPGSSKPPASDRGDARPRA